MYMHTKKVQLQIIGAAPFELLGALETIISPPQNLIYIEYKLVTNTRSKNVAVS